MTFHHIGNVIIPKNNPNWRQSIIIFRGVGQPPTSDNLILNWYPPNSTSVWGLLMGLLMGWLYYYTIPTTNQAFWGSYLEGPGTPRGKCHLFVAGKCHSSGPRGRRSCPDVCCKRMPSTRRQLRWEVSDKMVVLLGRWWFNGWFNGNIIDLVGDIIDFGREDHGFNEKIMDLVGKMTCLAGKSPN